MSVLRCQQHVEQPADYPDNVWAAGYVMEVVAELIVVSEGFTAEGRDQPDWMGRCLGLLREACETLVPQIRWEEIVVQASKAATNVPR